MSNQPVAVPCAVPVTARCSSSSHRYQSSTGDGIEHVLSTVAYDKYSVSDSLGAALKRGARCHDRPNGQPATMIHDTISCTQLLYTRTLNS